MYKILAVEQVKFLKNSNSYSNNNSNKKQLQNFNKTACYKLLCYIFEAQVTSHMNCNLVKNCPSQTLNLKVFKGFYKMSF